MTGSQGTAELTIELLRIKRQLDKDAERQRAMLLSWVDELERYRGYGKNPDKGPRTAQIRQWWRDNGEPKLN